MQTVPEGTELAERHLKPPQNFDPCCNAKVTSPFYLYNHDSPRPSFDVVKDPNPPKASVHDLESGTFNLSPTITEEKKEAQRPKPSRFKFWQGKSECLTKPKERGWLARLPTRQRILVKLLIALVVIGAIVGIAVGISIRVHGGVYKNNNSTHQIG
ncbi:uncharacterized protein A1O9_10231 [Exophiala aquamarina CBS 119918]|uniref:Uncharacterized protein n=1 Tax=Exophiala aquamarina CBS 119918 TaxID=1182545 RepID=A0A072P141_9EURO|nr:uncharacterized protein A1O9_10231 [Exophiala aquamarina CBS 119918]KEF53829.1 hypothetical protein A1O9_10231 [Exophiala aquamarina CBS 119918]